MNEIEPEKLERIFGGWLRWSSDREVLQLLELVARQLDRRGYRVTWSVERPQPEQ